MNVLECCAYGSLYSVQGNIKRKRLILLGRGQKCLHRTVYPWTDSRNMSRYLFGRWRWWLRYWMCRKGWDFRHQRQHHFINEEAPLVSRVLILVVGTGHHKEKMLQRWAVVRPQRVTVSWEGVFFLSLADPIGASKVVSTTFSLLQPISSQPQKILRDHSPCVRAASAVFLSWPPALGTRGFTDLAASMLIKIFS